MRKASSATLPARIIAPTIGAKIGWWEDDASYAYNCQCMGLELYIQEINIVIAMNEMKSRT